jgi:hypothetical protein
MRKHPQLFVSFLALVAGVAVWYPANAFAATIYVPDQYATIQLGIDAAVTGDTVVVRNGTYPLTAPIDFNGKAITVRSENGAANCILDGQQQTRLVYFHTGEGAESVLSGFTIRNGKAGQGGGIYCTASSPTISNCSITNNHADDKGGGIFCSASSTTFSHCIISGNSATIYNPYGPTNSYGGGIYVDGGSPTLADSTVTGNFVTSSGWYPTSSMGGGIFCNVSTMQIHNCTISNNSGQDYGGGILFSASIASVVNTIINGNSSRWGGGVYFSSSPAYLTNCTIVRNNATDTNSGGLHSANSAPKLVNVILWENAPVQIFKAGTGDPVVTYSDIDGGYSGTGNINASPLFVSIAQQDYHLTSSSPAINVGSNAASELPATDKEGNPRIVNGVVDMGALEYLYQLSPADFNFDGRPDILWRNGVTGENYVWYMNAASRLGGAWLPRVQDLNWKIVGVDFFNNDTKLDILWRNSSTGENYAWFMNGTTRVSGAWLEKVADLNWQIAGVADFNNDGKPDILWRNSVTGENYVWFMNGATRVSGAWLAKVEDLTWTIVGLGDFNSDTRPDILWRNSATGQNYVWYMNGTSRIGGAWLTTVADLNWKIVDSRDYNSDSKPDVLWRNTSTGENYIWYMNGPTRVGGAWVLGVADQNWSIVP